MSRRTITIFFLVSFLINVIAIPILVWKNFVWQSIYRRNVDYVAELAYAVGYHRALETDMATELESYPTRLEVTKVEKDRVEALICPAKGQRLLIEFSNPRICEASIR